MPWTQRDVDWVAARLLPDIYDLNQRVRYDRNTQRLEALYAELTKPMKIRITEDTFFYGQERRAGDVMNAPDGPYKNTVVGGKGLVRVPQFVELPEQIMTETQPTPEPAVPPPASFGEATAAVLKPVPKPATQAKTNASLLSQLATRRNKLHDTIKTNIDDYAKRLTDMETQAPAVFVKANALLDDEHAGFRALEDSLQEFAGANGAPLAG